MGLIALYLHIGSDVEIPIKNIIFILDVELARTKINKEFRVDEIINISTKKLKSLILVQDEDKKYTLFTSPISTYTLRKRLENFMFF